jgi:hypothetical protein
MVMCLTNVRRPSNKRRRALANVCHLFKLCLRWLQNGDAPTTQASPCNPSSTKVCATPTLVHLTLPDLRRAPMGTSRIRVSDLRFLCSGHGNSKSLLLIYN